MSHDAPSGHEDTCLRGVEGTRQRGAEGTRPRGIVRLLVVLTRGGVPASSHALRRLGLGFDGHVEDGVDTWRRANSGHVDDGVDTRRRANSGHVDEGVDTCRRANSGHVDTWRTPGHVDTSDGVGTWTRGVPTLHALCERALVNLLHPEQVRSRRHVSRRGPRHVSRRGPRHVSRRGPRHVSQAVDALHVSEQLGATRLHSECERLLVVHHGQCGGDGASARANGHVDGRVQAIGDAVGMSLPPDDETDPIDADEIVGDIGDLSCDNGVDEPTESLEHASPGDEGSSESAEILQRVFSRCVAQLLAEACQGRQYTVAQ